MVSLDHVACLSWLTPLGGLVGQPGALERTPDKREVASSTLARPTMSQLQDGLATLIRQATRPASAAMPRHRTRLCRV